MSENITDEEFEAKVLKSDVPVLVDFWAEWCGPCKILGPIIEDLSRDMGNKMKIFKMNIEQSPNVPSSLGVRSIPTIMLFNNGKHIDTKIGVLQKNTLIEWINSNVTL